jgi:hypothetical protein
MLIYTLDERGEPFQELGMPNTTLDHITLCPAFFSFTAQVLLQDKEYF